MILQDPNAKKENYNATLADGKQAATRQDCHEAQPSD
jgi:hypothetical protein